MTTCIFCSESINHRKKAHVQCANCERCCHAACLNDSPAVIISLLNDVQGLSWTCPDCLRNCITVDQESLKNTIQRLIDTSLETLSDTFMVLKDDFLKIAEEKLSSVALERPSVMIPPKKYTDMLKNNTQPAILIKPKDHAQSNSDTRKALSENINPIECSLQIAKVKHVKDGGVVVGCKNVSENEKLKKLAEEKLADNYDIREIRGIYPRIRIVGFRCSYDDQTLISTLIKLNPDIFDTTFSYKVIKISKTKRNSAIFQAVVEVDKRAYDNAMHAGNVFIGFDSCSVYEGIDIYRCFRCSELHHTSRSCAKSFCCPRCGGDHEVTNCSATYLSCPNCVKLRKTDKNINVAINHAAWDKLNCLAYQNALAKRRSDVLGD